MGLGDAIDEALTEHGSDAGQVVAEVDGGTATIDVANVGPIGVRVRRVRVRSDAPRDITEKTDALSRDVKALPGGLVPIEVDRGLGGSILRSDPDSVDHGEFYEAAVSPNEADVRRMRADPAGGRSEVDWDMTRKGLRQLVDELS